jgi:hypothetical protein
MEMRRFDQLYNQIAERPNPQVDALQKQVAAFAIAVVDALNSCLTRGTARLTESELIALGQTTETALRLLLADASLTRFQNQRVERYRLTLAQLQVLSGVAIHTQRFFRLSQSPGAALVRTPLHERLLLLVQATVPVIESLLTNNAERAEASLAILAEVHEQYAGVAPLATWQGCVEAVEYRLLRATFLAVANGLDALKIIAQEHRTTIQPTLAGRTAPPPFQRVAFR